MDPDQEAATEGTPARQSHVDVLRAVRYVAAVTIGGFALLSIAGWLSGALLLTRYNAAWVPMAPVTAIVFLLFSAGILLRLRVDAPALRALVIGSAVLVATAITLSLIDIATGIALSPDRLFLSAAQQGDPLQGGRMSPFTAVAMLVVILAGLLLESPRLARRTAGVHLALLVSVFGFILVVGYGYGAPLLYGGSVRPVSLPTSVALLLVGLGTAVSGVDAWPVAVFLGDSIRARLTRVVVPLVAAPVITLMVLDAATNRFGMRDDPLLFAVLFLVTMTAVVTIVLQVASRTGAQLDAAEAALRASEAQLRMRTVELERSNRDLEQFAYVASHDLQEPLRMVTGFTQLLQQRYEGRLDSDADEFIGYTLSGVKRMHDLIQELLEYARVGTRGGAFRPTNLNPALRQVLEMMDVTISEAGATVTSDELPVVVCDVNQIERVFQNLVGNAIKFRGEVPPEVHIGVRSTDSGWEFCVRDNGMGIAPEDSERVFKLFERLASGERYSGTGMGLTISKRIVERHGGTMWVEETPGGGATIAFTLARLEPSQPDVA